MIGNNSCGSHSVAWGTTADNVRELTCSPTRGRAARLGRGWARARPDGLRALVEGDLALLRTGFPELPRRISGTPWTRCCPRTGADVARAFCGSEGTLGVLTEATVRLVEAPARACARRARRTPTRRGRRGRDRAAAARAADGRGHGRGRSCVRADRRAASGAAAGRRLAVRGDGRRHRGRGTRARGRDRARGGRTATRAVVDRPGRAAGPVADPRGRTRHGDPDARRQRGLARLGGLRGAARPARRLSAGLPRAARRPRPARHAVRALRRRLHPRPHRLRPADRGRASPASARFSEDAADLVVAHGGSLSGEHGDGQARAELLPRMYGAGDGRSLRAGSRTSGTRTTCSTPACSSARAASTRTCRFAVLPHRPVDVALRLPGDGGDFSAAVRRCVGVAKCRTPAVRAAVMCPSFRATGEEAHSTRGRARLLHEMLAGEVVTDGWRSEEVRDALDLCLSCKGCRATARSGSTWPRTRRSSCTTTTRAAAPGRPLRMGRLPVWLRRRPAARPAWSTCSTLAARGPLAALAKRVGGIAPGAGDPRLARETGAVVAGRGGGSAGRIAVRAGSGRPAGFAPARSVRRRATGAALADTCAATDPRRWCARPRRAHGARLAAELPAARGLLRPDVRLDRPARPRAGAAPHPRRDGPGLETDSRSSSSNRAARPPCAPTSPSCCTTTRARPAWRPAC